MLPWTGTAAGPVPNSRHQENKLSAGVLAQIESLLAEKQTRNSSQQKIDSQLLYAMKMRLGAKVAMGVDRLAGVFTRINERFTFYGETTALVAFGVSWLTASRVLPLITRQDERFSPLREQNPP